MANLKELQARLGQSLDKAKTHHSAAAPALPAAALPHTPRPKGAPAIKGAKFTRLGISLFPTDLDRLAQIRGYLAARGQHITASQAIKVALRSTRLSEELAAALQAVKAEDGRGK